MKFKSTEKLFFGKYPYRLSIQLREESVNRPEEGFLLAQGDRSRLGAARPRSGSADSCKEWVDHDTRKRNLLNWARKETSGKIKAKHRIAETWGKDQIHREYLYDLFFSDPEFINKCKEKFGKQLTELVRPDNDNQLAAILTDATIRIRKNLFLGRTRFKIELSTAWHCLEQFEQTEIIASLPKGKVTARFSSIFIQDEETATLFKLSYPEYVRSVERAVLRSEL